MYLSQQPISDRKLAFTAKQPTALDTPRNEGSLKGSSWRLLCAPPGSDVPQIYTERSEPVRNIPQSDGTTIQLSKRDGGHAAAPSNFLL